MKKIDRKVLEALSDGKWKAGLPLSEEINAWLGTLYTSLHRLQKHGYVEAEYEDFIDANSFYVRGGLRRQLYRITSDGLNALSKPVQSKPWYQFW